MGYSWETRVAAGDWLDGPDDRDADDTVREPPKRTKRDSGGSSRGGVYDEGGLTRLMSEVFPPAMLRHAQLAVADRAVDADEARCLLAALGLIPVNEKEENP